MRGVLFVVAWDGSRGALYIGKTYLTWSSRHLGGFWGGSSSQENVRGVVWQMVGSYYACLLASGGSICCLCSNRPLGDGRWLDWEDIGGDMVKKNEDFDMVVYIYSSVCG